MQHALLGMVTRNLRSASVGICANNIYMYFYYDLEPSKKEIELSDIIIKDFASCFENISVLKKSFVKPEPQRISLQEGHFWIYWRYEKYLLDD